MLNFNRNDRLPDPKDHEAAARPATPAAGTDLAHDVDTRHRAAHAARAITNARPRPLRRHDRVARRRRATRPAASLSIGPNINLKGVEISNCDVLVIEGNVDATITSKAMEIAQTRAVQRHGEHRHRRDPRRVLRRADRAHEARRARHRPRHRDDSLRQARRRRRRHAQRRAEAARRAGRGDVRRRRRCRGRC